VVLQGWTDYNAGLDVEKNETGTHSLWAEWRDHKFMFHVSTLLPFSKSNSQQVERKRYIGNDVSVIVFQDSISNDQQQQQQQQLPYNPKTISSHVNHIVAVVRKIVNPTTASASASISSPPTSSASASGENSDEPTTVIGMEEKTEPITTTSPFFPGAVIAGSGSSGSFISGTGLSLSGGTKYKLAFSAKHGIPPYGTKLTSPLETLYDKNDHFRDLFFSKRKYYNPNSQQQTTTMPFRSRSVLTN
jgi:hypothetical protein